MPSPGSHFGGGPVVESPPPPLLLLDPSPAVVPSLVLPVVDVPEMTPPVVVSVVVAVGSTVVDVVTVVGSSVDPVVGLVEFVWALVPEPLSVLVGVTPLVPVGPGPLPPLEPPLDSWPPLTLGSVADVESPHPASARPSVAAASRPPLSLQGRLTIGPLCERPPVRVQQSTGIPLRLQVNNPTDEGRERPCAQLRANAICAIS